MRRLTTLSGVEKNDAPIVLTTESDSFISDLSDDTLHGIFQNKAKNVRLNDASEDVKVESSKNDFKFLLQNDVPKVKGPDLHHISKSSGSSLDDGGGADTNRSKS